MPLPVAKKFTMVHEGIYAPVPEGLEEEELVL
jgi:hypothetical protein